MYTHLNRFYAYPQWKQIMKMVETMQTNTQFLITAKIFIKNLLNKFVIYWTIFYFLSFHLKHSKWLRKNKIGFDIYNLQYSAARIKNEVGSSSPTHIPRKSKTLFSTLSIFFCCWKYLYPKIVITRSLPLGHNESVPSTTAQSIVIIARTYGIAKAYDKSGSSATSRHSKCYNNKNRYFRMVGTELIHKLN